MQSDKNRLIREIAHATELDFNYVEITLNEIITDEIHEHTGMLEYRFQQTINKLQKELQSLKDDISILKGI